MNKIKQDHDNTFHSPEHYIELITEEIWESRGVSKIYNYYTEDVIIETSLGKLVGIEGVVQGTIGTLNMFPNRELLPEKILIKGNLKEGFYSSHLVLSPNMYHSGNGVYGNASKNKATVRTIADCLVREDKIYHEWLVRDQLGILSQLGFDVVSYAKQMKNDLDSKRIAMLVSEVENTLIEEEELIVQQYLNAMHELWTKKSLHKIKKIYHRACRVEAPNFTTLYGHKAVDEFYLKYFASLENIRHSIDHVIVNKNESSDKFEVATRFRVAANYRPDGHFFHHDIRTRNKENEQKEIYILAISHAEIIDGKVVNEWLLIDELALWQQLFCEK